MDENSDGHFLLIRDYLDNAVTFSFLENIPGGHASVPEQREEILAFIQTLCANAPYRRCNAHTLAFIKNGFYSRSIQSIFDRKQNLFERIHKEDRFNFERDSFIQFMSAALIIHDLVYTKGPAVYTGYTACADFEIKAGYFIDETLQLCGKLLPSVSEIFLSLIFKSIIPHTEGDERVSVSSKIVAIFDRLAKIRSYFDTQSSPAVMPAYTGALHILQANSAFFGLDRAIINELADAEHA
ncbi:MAG: hypothetical protein HZC28_12375 [Spirochaetes bacterium]|nr:hypothetical protein [Spirochaetota bacterium]